MIKSNRLKILDNINIPVPCSESWDKMAGDERTRHCDHCSHSVTDISELTRKEAASLLRSGGSGGAGRLCIRYRQDDAGRIVFRAPPRSRFSPVAVFFSALIAAIGLGGRSNAAAETPACEDKKPPTEMIHKLGKVASTQQPAQSPTPTPTPQTDGASKSSDDISRVIMGEVQAQH